MLLKGLIIIILIVFTFGCNTRRNNNNYYLITDTVKSTAGYVDSKGDTVIPLGKYLQCFTDTFKNYAIVSKQGRGFIAINKEEKELYQVYAFDNGPDYIVDGLFRIVKDNKIGYADINGNVIIEPQYGCAFPFENGIAKVSKKCKTVADADGEHHIWISDNWVYINKHNRVTIK